MPEIGAEGLGFDSLVGRIGLLRSSWFKVVLPKQYDAGIGVARRVIANIMKLSKAPLRIFRGKLLELLLWSLPSYFLITPFFYIREKREEKSGYLKSNLYYIRRITPKRVTSCGVHLRGLAPG